VLGFASRDFSLSPHPAKSNAAKTIRNDRVLIRRKSERNKLSSTNRQATWCPVPEIAGILPEVSWLFFKARAQHPYPSHTDRASNAEKQPTGPGPEGCDENGPAAALLVGHVSIQICSLLAPCRRPILIATMYLLFRGQDTRANYNLLRTSSRPPLPQSSSSSSSFSSSTSCTRAVSIRLVLSITAFSITRPLTKGRGRERLGKREEANRKAIQ
jgi:hypothetical protein